MRWSSSAHNNQKAAPRRERFSTVYAVLGIFSAFLLLLALLYPEERLLDILGRSHDGDAATIRYLEALLRVRPDDSQLRLRLAGAFLQAGLPRKALAAVGDSQANYSFVEQHKALELRYRALKGLLADPGLGEDARRRYLSAFSAAIRQLVNGGSKEWQLRNYAADARQAGDLQTWRLLLRRADAMAPPAQQFAGMPSDPFAAALARGDYRAAAALCFLEMRQAIGNARKRELLFKGVRTLQSGNLPVEAFEAGERHLDGLADDRETLVFLTRAGLAAGKPERAQRLIRRALKMTQKTATKDLS
ncbi:MAG: hypothetical protein CXR30_05675 [Geobacter sp.]|nr:MAG: hypothetical protein CXR30_05675 [Geobacter sp.]